jgi:hypothetical protein
MEFPPTGRGFEAAPFFVGGVSVRWSEAADEPAGERSPRQKSIRFFALNLDHGWRSFSIATICVRNESSFGPRRRFRFSW